MVNKITSNSFIVVLLLFGMIGLSSCSRLRNTTWEQTGGLIWGETGFTIDFGRDSFIATNGNTVRSGSVIVIDRLEGRYQTERGETIKISGNALTFGQASFRKVDRGRDRDRNRN